MRSDWGVSAEEILVIAIANLRAEKREATTFSSRAARILADRISRPQWEEGL